MRSERELPLAGCVNLLLEDFEELRFVRIVIWIPQMGCGPSGRTSLWYPGTGSDHCSGIVETIGADFLGGFIEGGRGGQFQ